MGGIEGSRGKVGEVKRGRGGEWTSRACGRLQGDEVSEFAKESAACEGEGGIAVRSAPEALVKAAPRARVRRKARACQEGERARACCYPCVIHLLVWTSVTRHRGCDNM